MAEMQGEGRLRAEDWQVQLTGEAYAGKFSAELEGTRQPATLTIHELQLSDMQPELHPGWREWLTTQPFQQVDLRRLDISHLSLISFDDSVPLTMKWLDLFLTDLRWTTWLLIASVGRIPSIVTSTVGGDALGMQNYQFAVVTFLATLVIAGVGLLIYRQVCRRHDAHRGSADSDT